MALGLARFAYALVLPAMQRDLGWSYTQAGGLNTANALGYLLGALLAAPLGRRFGLRLVFLAGLALSALALLASGLHAAYGLALLWRALAGVSGALTFVTGGALAAQLGTRFSGRVAATLVGLYFGGSGLGILASGLLLPGYLAARGDPAWSGAWFLVGGLAIMATLLAVGLVPRSGGGQASGAQTSTWPTRPFLPSIVAYFLFGAGYVSYMTFVIAFLRGGGFGAAGLSAFWALLGAAVIVSGLVWRPVIQGWPTRRALPTIMLTLAVGAALPLLSAAPLAVYVSGALFGGSFLTVVNAITALVRRQLPAAMWTAALGGLTAAFSVGQILGPVLTGLLADLARGLTWGLGASVGLLLLGAVVSLWQQEDRAA